MYANRKAWPLERAVVRLTHRRVHAKDCEDCEHEEGRVHVIDKIVELEGDLDDAQRERLMQIADKCPVHKTLLGQLEIHTRAG